MSKSKSIAAIFGIGLLFYPLLGYCFEVASHEAINIRIAGGTFDGFSLGDYLRNDLGFQNGINQRVDNSVVWMWLRDGGRYEDIPWNPPFDLTPAYLRSVNHF